MLGAVVVAILFILLNWYIAPSGAEQKQALVVTLAQILGGTALLSGLYFTWRTLQVNREGQITDRFTRAIDQLGATHDDNKNLELRLGGIYALERIARESKEDHWSIMEVLTAYVRQHAPWIPPDAPALSEEEKAKAKDATAKIPSPDLDIQAIITVIRQRTRSLGHGEPEPLDLNQTNLTRVNLMGANLSGVNLMGANLFGADLREADLRGAWLSADPPDPPSEPYLWGANLLGTHLEGAHLEGAHLGGVKLAQAQLEETSGDENTVLPPTSSPPTTGACGLTNTKSACKDLLSHAA